MPASMIRAPTGSSPKVIGKSMAIVAIGPTPGSTPISVPTRQPTKQRSRLTGIGHVTPMNASVTQRTFQTVSKPIPRLKNISSMAASEVDDAGDDQDRNRQTQDISEQADAEGRHDSREDDDLSLAHLRGGVAANDHRQGSRDHEPEQPDRDGEGQDPGNDKERTAEAPRFEPRVAPQRRDEHEQDGAVEQDDHRIEEDVRPLGAAVERRV